MQRKGDLSVELGPGRKIRGEVAYSVDKGQHEWELIIQPIEFGIGQAIFKVSENVIK